jgi:hypothetical protein
VILILFISIYHQHTKFKKDKKSSVYDIGQHPEIISKEE